MQPPAALPRPCKPSCVLNLIEAATQEEVKEPSRSEQIPEEENLRYDGTPLLNEDGTLNRELICTMLAKISLTLKDLILYGTVTVHPNDDGNLFELIFSDARRDELRVSFYKIL